MLANLYFLVGKYLLPFQTQSTYANQTKNIEKWYTHQHTGAYAGTCTMHTLEYVHAEPIIYVYIESRVRASERLIAIGAGLGDGNLGVTLGMSCSGFFASIFVFLVMYDAAVCIYIYGYVFGILQCKRKTLKEYSI